MSLRDQIRTATLGSGAKFKSEVVEYNGIEVEIRQPSVKVRTELFNKCMDENGRVKMTEFLVWAMIYNTFVPNTEELVFEEEDYDSLMARPAGGFLDKFGNKASELLNVEDDIEKKSTASAKTLTK